jgi:hypothetical protein
VHKHAAACVKAILYELVAGWEVFEEILIVHIVHFHNFVSVASKQIFVQR